MRGKVRKLTIWLKSEYKNFIAKAHTCPIILTGNQKSGTSAIAGLLGKSTNMEVQMDIPEIWDKTTLDLANNKIELEKIIKKNKLRFNSPIIKEPDFFEFVPQLRQVYSNSKAVFIIRDPRDNIRSLLNRLNLYGNLEDIQKFDSSVDMESIPMDYRRMLWSDENKTYIENLADRWNKACDVYLSNQDYFIVLIKYEDFKQKKKKEIYNLAEKLNLSVQNDISDFVNIQYQPKGDNSESWLEFFGYDNLNKIETICEVNMKNFGYKNKSENN